MTSPALLQVAVGGDRPYSITVGAGALADGAALVSHVRGRHVLLLSDSEVAPRYLAPVKQTLLAARPDLIVGEHVLAAGEASKTLAEFGRAIEALAALGATRDACVFALGGGVVGDLAGFAAACWMRGVDCVQLPTTLLAMVDSSVGGKTAVDIPAGKNLVGAFHPPRAVIADTRVLATLPPRELRAGLAEVVKYGALGDAVFFEWLQQHADALLAGEDATLAEAIARSCRHKAAIVERDPFEKGERALLNLGHTFGHAIETGLGYGVWLHGEAVAAGTVMAAELSACLGWIGPAEVARVESVFRLAGLPVSGPDLGVERYLELMRHDKKVEAGKLRLVLFRGIGDAVVSDAASDEQIAAAIAARVSAA